MRPAELLNHVWKKLLEVKTLSFSAQSKAIHKSGWDGVGKGQVNVNVQSDTVIIFNEKGVWISSEGKEFDFHNIFRWNLERSKKVITLEHLRFGEKNPVFLFHLAPIDENMLESVGAHVCREDIYLGTVWCDHRSMHFNWRVLGPKKNEEIIYLYS